MAYIIKITNVLNQEIVSNYRMPKDKNSDDIRFNPVLSVEIQPRAMLNDIIFPDKHYYEEWRRQNDSLFTSGILIEGAGVSESKILAEHEKLNKENLASGKEKIDKKIEKIEESADNVNIGLSFDVDTEENSKKRGRKNKN